MKIHKLIVATFFLLIIAGNGDAASFDCTKAVSEIEKIICGDDELSRLDESLSKAYLEALKRADIKKQTIKSQRQWLKNERNACQNAECIKTAYETRIRELGLSSHGVVTSRPPDRSTPSSKAPPRVSKSQAIEQPDKAIQTKTEQQHRSATDSVNNAPVVEKITCVTDKIEYSQGEKVLITITNNSSEDIRIPNREYIDGRFARPAWEVKLKHDKIWITMKMVMARDDIQIKSLKQNESHVYSLRLLTMDESRNENISTPGVYAPPHTYKVFFHTGKNLFPFKIESNEFTVRSNIGASK